MKKIQITLEEFKRGNISIKCSSQKQVDAIADWAKGRCASWNKMFPFVSYIGPDLLTWPNSEDYNYKYKEVELV